MGAVHSFSAVLHLHWYAVLVLLVRRHYHEQPLQLVGGGEGEGVEPARLPLPLDEDEVDRHCRQDHGQTDPRLYRLGDHRQQGNDEGHAEVHNGEGEVDFDWSGQVRLLPAEVGQAEHGGTNGEPGCEPQVVHQDTDIAKLVII